MKAEPVEFSDYVVKQDRLELAFDRLVAIPDWPVYPKQEPNKLGLREVEHTYARGGVVMDSGEPPLCDGVCHGFMGSRFAGLQEGLPQVTFSKWNYRAEPEYHESQTAWFDWITGPISPWRSIFPPKRVVRGVDISSREFMWKHGFLLWHLDKLPSNAQQSFLIATRAPTQRCGLVYSWYRLVTEHGFDPAFAAQWLILWDHNNGRDNSYQIYQHDFLDRYNYTLNYNGIGEYFLGANISKEYVSNFVAGRMVEKKLNPPYRTQTSYTPVNDIWHNENSTGWYSRGSIWMPPTKFEKYTDFLNSYGFAETRYEGSAFAQDERSEMGKKIYTKEAMLKLADTEMRRMKIGLYKENDVASAA